MNREKVLDIAIKQTANPTNWGLNFFRASNRGCFEPLKHRGPVLTRGGGANTVGREGESRDTEKKSIGVPDFPSPLHRRLFSPEKRRHGGAGSAKIGGCTASNRETKFCKGGTDGGGS